MSCEVRVVLDRHDRQFASGEKIAGHVSVTLDEPLVCEALVIFMRWATAGEGARVEGEDELQIRLYEGAWEAGCVRYPFTLVAPDGPFSYQGHFLSVEWEAVAHATLADREPVVASEVFFLSPPAAGQVDDTQRAVVRTINAAREEEEPNHSTFFLIAGVALLLLGAVAVVTSNLAGAILNTFMSGAAVMGGLVCLGFVARGETDRMGKVDIYLNPSAVFPSAKVNTLLLFIARRAMSIEQITATVRGKEIVHKEVGKKQVTLEHVFFEEAHELASAQDVAQGRLVKASANFEVAADAPLSFHTAHNEIVWEIEYHVRIARWPDWTQTRYMVIGPPTPGA